MWTLFLFRVGIGLPWRLHGRGIYKFYVAICCQTLRQCPGKCNRIYKFWNRIVELFGVRILCVCGLLVLVKSCYFVHSHSFVSCEARSCFFVFYATDRDRIVLHCIVRAALYCAVRVLFAKELDNEDSTVLSSFNSKPGCALLTTMHVGIQDGAVIFLRKTFSKVDKYNTGHINREQFHKGWLVCACVCVCVSGSHSALPPCMCGCAACTCWFTLFFLFFFFLQSVTHNMPQSQSQF